MIDCSLKNTEYHFDAKTTYFLYKYPHCDNKLIVYTEKW